MSNNISKPQTKPLTFIKCDCEVSKNGKGTTYTADPKLIDKIITKNWKNIFKGNSDNLDKLVDDFFQKYEKRIFI